MTAFMTTKIRRSRYQDGHAWSEYGWKCTCGKKSLWFPTPARRDEAKRRHEQAHLNK